MPYLWWPPQPLIYEGPGADYEMVVGNAGPNSRSLVAVEADARAAADAALDARVTALENA